MNSLAEAHVSKMRFDEASKVLEKLIQREPQNSQHRTKLQFVRSQMGGADTMPVRPKSGPSPVADLPAMEIDEPAPSFDVVEESSFSLDLDTSEPIELDLDSVPASPAPAAPPPPLQQLMPAVEIAAADMAEGGDDLDFITEHLTEAEVFAKYGLAEKAAEHLRAVLERAPKNLTAHERLFRILLEEGDTDGARNAALAYVAVLEEKGDSATIQGVRNEFTSRGHALERTVEKPAPARPATPTIERRIPVSAPAPPAPVPAPEITLDDFSGGSDEMTFDLDGSAEIEFDVETPAEEIAEEIPIAEEVVEFSSEPLSSPEPEPLPAAASLPDSLSFDDALPIADEIPEIVEEEVTFDFGDPALPSIAESFYEPTPAPVSPQELAFDSDPLSFASPASDVEQTEPFFGVESDLDGLGSLVEELPEELPLEEIGEVDFYIEQELFDEARRKLEALELRFPSNPDLSLRRDRLDAAASAAATSAQRPAALSRDEIESELLSAIPDDDDELLAPIPPPPPPAPAAAPAPAALSASLIKEENLFADEDNFFDLAAELESELADEEEAISLSEEEQSLEEIFKEFKKGVEQQLDSEDYDTHYNLGIAYKEMGLIDEAIGEFQLASKDPKRAVECASMLGLCFLEKGMPQLAIKWYRKGLEMPEITEEEHVGLLYDLGSAYQEVGDTENAQKAFMEVYGMNTNYRDIVSRIKQLEDSRR